MTLPNFLIIGSPKSGTTSLYHYLNQHPQIYMSPVKEPRFLCLDGEILDWCGPGDKKQFIDGSITKFKDYQALFEGVSNEIAIGEASTWYLYYPRTPEKVKHYIPDVKLIAILRNPAERAYSNYLMNLRLGNESLKDFAQALQAEDQRVENNWSQIWFYKRRGYYYKQLKPYFDVFGNDKIKVYLYDDLKSDLNGLLKDIFEFLGVDGQFIPNTTAKYNTAKPVVPKNQLLYDFFTKDNPMKAVLRPFLSEEFRRSFVSSIKAKDLTNPSFKDEVKEQLLQDYLEDIQNLQDLIGRDLSVWIH